MKRLFAAMMVCVVAAGMLAGCGDVKSDGREDAPVVTKAPAEKQREEVKTVNSTGRYVEDILPMDAVEGSALKSALVKGEPTFFIREYVSEESQGAPVKISAQVLRNGALEYAEMESLDTFIEAADISDIRQISASPNGSVVILYVDTEDKFRIARCDDGGEFAEVPVSGWGEGLQVAIENSLQLPNNVCAVDDGFFIQYGEEIRRYNQSGAETGRFLSSYSAGGPVVYGGMLAVPANDWAEIELYNLETGELQESIKTGLGFEAMFSTHFALDKDGLLLAKTNGVFRWNGAEFDMVVDGAETSLILPDARINTFMTDDNGVFYAVLGTGGQVTRFYFDENAAPPDVSLEIFSLIDNETIRKTMNAFQLKQPHVKVNLTVIGSDTGATDEDIIRSLNTEILAGKGPDLLVLDGLPIESYIEKGVLKDISQSVEGWIEEHGLTRNLSNTYARNGKIYGLPSRLAFPVMAGKEEYINQVGSLEALVDIHENYNHDSVRLQYPPRSLSLSLWQGGDVMMEYYDMYESKWFDGEKIDEAGLAEYLTNALNFYHIITEIGVDEGRPGSTFLVLAGFSGQERIYEGPQEIKGGRYLISLYTIGGIVNLAEHHFKLGSLDGMTMKSMFNFNQYYPVAGVGIVSNSKKQELAEDFIELLISREIQDTYLMDGFAVNEDSMEYFLEYTQKASLGGYYDNIKTQMDNLGFMEMYRNFSEPMLTDAVIRAAVSARHPALVDGTLTPEQAAAEIVSSTRLYLAE